jgi:hypothetical protein
LGRSPAVKLQIDKNQTSLPGAHCGTGVKKKAGLLYAAGESLENHSNSPYSRKRKKKIFHEKQKSFA